jgi:hypothetical protein
MAFIKTFGVLAGIGALSAMALRSERAWDVEDTQEARAAIERGIRHAAADFDPRVSLTQRELRNFEVVSSRVLRPAAVGLFEKVAGGDRNFDVYVRYREGSSERCLTLSLKHRASDGSWTTAHNRSADYCEPSW